MYIDGELLITFDIRNIIQWAYLFTRTPVKKLQPIVSSILGPIYSSFMFALLRVPGTKSGIKLLIFALEQKLKVHWNGIQKTCLLSYYTSKSEQAENSLVLPSIVSL